MTAIDCHSLGIYTVILLFLLSFLVKLTVPPMARSIPLWPTDYAEADDPEAFQVRETPCRPLVPSHSLHTIVVQSKWQVRKIPCRPRSWANYRPLQLYHQRNAWANLTPFLFQSNAMGLSQMTSVFGAAAHGLP
jgi:hypothetical protein